MTSELGVAIPLLALIGSGLALYLKLQINAALLAMKLELLDAMNARYATRDNTDQRFGDIERRLNKLEA